MNSIWGNKKVLIIISIAVVIISVFVCSVIYMLYISINSLYEPREISYKSYLPRSATEINEKTEYIQPPPDEEYIYYLKAKITEEDFKEIVSDLKLEFGSPNRQGPVPLSKADIPWWNPPSGTFSYTKGSMQADFVYLTGYMYLYIEEY